MYSAMKNRANVIELYSVWYPATSSYSNTYTDSNAYSNTNTYTDSNAYSNTNTYSNTNSRSS